MLATKEESKQTVAGGMSDEQQLGQLSDDDATFPGLPDESNLSAIDSVNGHGQLRLAGPDTDAALDPADTE